MGCHSYTSEAPQTFLHTVYFSHSNSQSLHRISYMLSFVCLIAILFQGDFFKVQPLHPLFKQHGHDIHHSFMYKIVQFTLKLVMDMSISSGRATSENECPAPTTLTLLPWAPAAVTTAATSFTEDGSSRWS